MALIKVTYVCPDCKDAVYFQFEKLDDVVRDHKTDDRLCDTCSKAEVLSFNQFYKGH
mgnify:CR=1 FL=1